MQKPRRVIAPILVGFAACFLISSLVLTRAARSTEATRSAAASEGQEGSSAGGDSAKPDPQKEKGSFWKFLHRKGGDAEQAEAVPAAEPAVSGAPRNLARAQARLRAGPVGSDPKGRLFLDRIDRGPTSMDLNAFATYLAKRGLTQDALLYEQEALRSDRRNPMLWLNLGTLQRDLGHSSAAMSAYERALDLDPNNALAHYNIASIHDANGNYDQAVEEYKTALTLDPSLADPVKNPQIVNNDRLLVVNLLLYQQRAGALGLPLVVPPAPKR